MSDEQLEIAARQYCRLTNQNADHLVNNPELPGTKVPRWMTYVPKIQQLWTVQEAIMFAMKP